MTQTMKQTMKQWKLLAAVMMLGGAMGPHLSYRTKRDHKDE